MDELEIAKITAYKIGKIQRSNFRKKFRIIRKSTKELVSDIDMECQELANILLGKVYPVISEEKNNDDNLKTFWVIDPIDGTHNFIAGLPNFGVSIGLIKNNQFELGVIYLPFYDEMYYSLRGNGAFKNGKPIRVSNNDDIEKSMITYDNQFYLDSNSFNIYKRLIDSTFTTRITGSAIYDFSQIISGVIDARIWNNTKIFDFVAGVIILQEAGGKVTDFNGNPITLKTKKVIASNGKVHKNIMDIIKGGYY